MYSEELRNGERVTPDALLDGLLSGAPKGKRRDATMTLAVVAGLAASAPLGLLWWVINGSYSVLGLAALAGHFGSYADVGYAILANWTFHLALPAADRLGLPTTQPILPWLLVIGASVLQVIIGYRSSRRLRIPPWMVVFTVLLSAYDIGTTWYGLGQLKWVLEGGAPLQAFLALILTFGLEGLIIGFQWPKR